MAEGHLLADERGAVGERYILGGRNFTFDRLFADLGRLSGVDPPVKLAAAPARAAARVLRRRRPAGPLAANEVRAASQWWTYRSTKARRELGWRSRPHEETLEADRGLAPRARARPDRAQPPLPAAPVPGGGRGRWAWPARRWAWSGVLPVCGPGTYPERRGHPLPLQGAHRPRLPLRAGGAQAARAGDRVRGGPGAVPEARPPRGRGADRPALGAGARPRRRGDLTTRTGSSSTSTGSSRRRRRERQGRARARSRRPCATSRRCGRCVLMAWERWQTLSARRSRSATSARRASTRSAAATPPAQAAAPKPEN